MVRGSWVWTMSPLDSNLKNLKDPSLDIGLLANVLAHGAVHLFK